jgi:lipopolysaccharide/colanic/teichoic acid biosynthesis glycosyltransferase
LAVVGWGSQEGQSFLSKRILDVTLGTILAVVVTPIIVLAAVGSALVLRTWPLFSQQRVGKDGREFRILKIRTLARATPRYADKYQISRLYIHRYCQMLRRFHIDELPQLWLVPLGQMSLVGPRPEMPLLHDDFDPSFADLRTSVRPGCSGLWQIGEGADHLIFEAPEYDEVYIANAGLRMDLWVLWRTVGSMFRLVPPVTIDDLPTWVLRRTPAAAVPALLTVPADRL